MKNLTSLAYFTITCVLSLIEVTVAKKTQVSVIAAELLFITAGFTACIFVLKTKKTFLPQPVKVKALRKY